MLIIKLDNYFTIEMLNDRYLSSNAHYLTFTSFCAPKRFCVCAAWSEFCVCQLKQHININD